jgi:hypothetical protein
LGVSFWNGLRLAQGIIFWSTLQLYKERLGSIYIVFSGGIWLVIGLFITWSLWESKSWAWSATITTTLSYGIWYWFDRLILQEPHANWSFALSITLILIVLSFSILLSPKTRQSFLKDAHDR